MTRPDLLPESGPEAEARMRQLTRRAFAVGAASAAVGAVSWAWLRYFSNGADGTPWALRQALRANEGLAGVYFSPRHLAPTFPPPPDGTLFRINDMRGLFELVDSSAWRLRIQHGSPKAPMRETVLLLNDLRGLPRVDLTTSFKCVEGWSEIVHWTGFRFLDFLTHFGLGTRSGQPPDPEKRPADLYPYVYMATPGTPEPPNAAGSAHYYVGLDMPSLLHPQTLLCEAINGVPLTNEHGAPLRLMLTVKYGYKNIKRIGLIRFQDERPPDLWADRGYDWYAGL